MIATLAVSLLVFTAISRHVERKYLYPVFEAADQLELESARHALETGGAAAVAAYMNRLNGLFGGTSHYLLDSRGVDVVSAVDRSELLPASPSAAKSRESLKGKLVITHRSPDGLYWFVAVDPRQPDRWTFLPYYILVIAATGALCWVAAVGVVSPIRRITAAVERFGEGAWSTRVEMHRRDEIGTLARSFDGMAERLQRSFTSERRLLEDISHELRSPLARLKVAVRLARTSDDSKMALDRVERDVNRLTALVSEIVEVTRIEGDPASQEKEQVRIAEVIEETVEDCRVEAEFRGCSIQIVGRVNSEVSGDRELLRRAFENVLRNAIRYSPEQAMIEVGLAEEERAVIIEVRDFGPGVPEHALTQIFEPFFRVGEARDSGSGGVGLGLSIAKRAVGLHHGTIVAENAGPGLRVRISVPV
jgi:signal transduction histidine kinase